MTCTSKEEKDSLALRGDVFPARCNIIRFLTVFPSFKSLLLEKLHKPKTMKKIKLLSTLLLLASVLLISSCKKDDDPVLTKTQLLTQNTWKYSSGTSSDPAIQAILVLYNGQEYVFKIDKTFTGILGGFPVSGVWEFSENETHLILNKGTTDEVDFEITTLDATILELKIVDTGVIITLKYTKKQ